MCREEAFWVTESDWCFKKGFHTVFDVLVTHEVFSSLTMFAFEGKGNALLFCHNWQLFFSSSYHICDQFLWACPQKNICIANWLLLLKKKTSKLKLKEDEIIGGKKNRISEDFLDLSTENRKFRRYCILSLFGQWNQSKEFSKQLSFSGSKVHPLKRNIKNRQRICFLFVDWANWKFFFFCGRNVSCLNCFFLPLKERF